MSKSKKSTIRESGINYIKLENFYKFLQLTKIGNQANRYQKLNFSLEIVKIDINKKQIFP